MLDTTTKLLYSMKHEMFFLIVGSIYVYIFSPYIFNCKDAEALKAIEIPEDPSTVYMVSECEN